MRLGWDKIKRRAKVFSEAHADAHYEKGETQTFYNEFFEIFGIKRRTVAVFEKRVALIDNKQGFIDLFWPRTPRPVLPTSMTRTLCPAICARPMSRSTWRWTGCTAPRPLHPTATGWNICSGAMKRW